MKSLLKILASKALLLFLFSNLTNAQSAEEVLDSANNCYLNNNFQCAAALYLRLVEAGYEAPGLFYNLGNTFYKQNKIAQAVLYYERAFKLDPYDEDIKYNLNLAYSGTADRIETIPDFFLKSWYKSVYNLLSPVLWAVLSIVFLSVALLLVFLNLIYNKSFIKSIALPAGIISLVLTCILFIFSVSRRNFIQSSDTAIITDMSIGVKSSPDIQGTNVFVLHEGTKVTILDQLDNWNEIRTGNGNVGWVPASSLTVI